jgi:hypothetical protein
MANFPLNFVEGTCPMCQSSHCVSHNFRVNYEHVSFSDKEFGGKYGELFGELDVDDVSVGHCLACGYHCANLPNTSQGLEKYKAELALAASECRSRRQDNSTPGLLERFLHLASSDGPDGATEHETSDQALDSEANQ